MLQLRPYNLLIYRIICLSVLALSGLSCLAIVSLSYFMDVRLIETTSQVEHEALYSSLGIMGSVCLIFVSTLIYLMQERRDDNNDRRRMIEAIDFPDRRVGADRRTVDG